MNGWCYSQKFLISGMGLIVDLFFWRQNAITCLVLKTGGYRDHVIPNKCWIFVSLCAHVNTKSLECRPLAHHTKAQVFHLQTQINSIALSDYNWWIQLYLIPNPLDLWFQLKDIAPILQLASIYDSHPPSLYAPCNIVEESIVLKSGSLHPISTPSSLITVTLCSTMAYTTASSTSARRKSILRFTTRRLTIAMMCSRVCIAYSRGCDILMFYGEAWIGCKQTNLRGNGSLHLWKFMEFVWIF